MEPERPTEPMLVNWEAIEERLFTLSHKVIVRFGREYPEVVCSFFACAVDLPFFLVSFDTPANAISVAQQGDHLHLPWLHHSYQDVNRAKRSLRYLS